MSIAVPGIGGPVVAIDDGGLTLRTDMRRDKIMELEITVALLEVKKCLSFKENYSVCQMTGSARCLG